MSIQNLPMISFGIANTIEVIVLADYFSRKGDNRLQNALDSNIEKFISHPNFSLDKLIEGLNIFPEEIFEIAERELGLNNNDNEINTKINNILKNR